MRRGWPTMIASANEQGSPSTAVITKTKPQTKWPNMYRAYPQR
jgi:hypothetical protein